VGRHATKGHALRNRRHLLLARALDLLARADVDAAVSSFELQWVL